MKFLIALSVLASSTVFANNGDYIKCYESPQETRHQEVAVKFRTGHGDMGETGLNRWIGLVKPFHAEMEQRRGCLHTSHDEIPGVDGRDWLKACPGEGQDIRGLVPVDIESSDEEVDETTVYCEREINRWFRSHDDDMM